MGKPIKIISKKYPRIPHLEFEGILIEETPRYFFVYCDKNTVLTHHINKETYITPHQTLHFFSKYHGYTVSIGIDDNFKPINSFCNISTPCLKDEAGNITYTDLEMDYVQKDNGKWELLKHEDFVKRSQLMHYPFQLTNFALVSLQELKNNISDGIFPFGVETYEDVKLML
ncbi:DUF402 domain-containing protein [Macrococcus sp. DPC7161]|uniref:DUF402 domain-containing protein n=1 Tax=Macrococcus sp. DPC7161 TaxID=2507060 RepID=UPI00100C297C|nr:DUF402 domain-containing protein [Macrococcus sp. DPC7161]RXK17276.1 DUF402 domain-containing protein [Macrococcus sp. DPC7161]